MTDDDTTVGGIRAASPANAPAIDHSMLDPLKPGESAFGSSEGHTFRFVATDQFGVHTGLRRYLVECISCGEVVHEATTGPIWNVAFHLREVARKAEEQKAAQQEVTP